MKEKTSRKSQREARTRRNIMRAAKYLFSRKGYKDTSVDEITDKALIAKATLYQYFKNKESLFLETIKDSEKNIVDLFEKINSNEKLKLGRQKIKALFFYLLGYFEKDSYAIHMAFYRESYFNQEIISFIHGFLNRLSQLIQKFLTEQGMEEEKTKILATSILGAGYVHVVKWYVNGKKESLKNIAEPLFKQFYPYIALSIKKNKKQTS